MFPHGRFDVPLAGLDVIRQTPPVDLVNPVDETSDALVARQQGDEDHRHGAAVPSAFFLRVRPDTPEFVLRLCDDQDVVSQLAFLLVRPFIGEYPVTEPITIV